MKRPRKTPEDLRQSLRYDAETGKLFWLQRDPASFTCQDIERTRVSSRWNKLRAGREAGQICGVGYVTLCIEGRNYAAHRIAWALHYGSWPTGQIDHINHKKSDNRIANLRDVTAAENAKNRPLARTNSSGTTGVYHRKSTDRWRATVWDGSRKIELGAFRTKEQAIEARIEAQSRLGFHPNHGAAQ